MQWVTPPPADGRHNPLRRVLEIAQEKAAPYLDQYGERWGYGDRLNSIVKGGTEMVPGVGDLVALEDLQVATQEGDAVGMGLGLLSAIPGIPAIGRGVGRGARAAGRLVDSASSAVRAAPSEAEAALARYQTANPTDTGARVLSPGDEGYPTNAQWDEASQAYVAPRAESVADLVASAEARGVRLDLSEGRNGLTLSRIEVPQGSRSRGVGSEIMRQIEGYADSRGLPVGLTPSGDFGGSVPRLKQFYSRFGFEPNTGRSRDFSTRETMLRQPRASEAAPVAEPDYPIRAYHGSPHSFDRFSMDAIGTGEGAQAYGHGLYFAESEDVARQYRDTLSTSINDGAQRRLEREGGDIDAAISKAREMADRYRSGGAESYARAVEEDLRGLERYQQTGEWVPGSMYEVGINAQPDTFLDWDRPLSEQPEAVRNAVSGIPDLRGDSGGYIWDSLVKHQNAQGAFGEHIADVNPAITTGPTAASRALRDAGVPGIRYLDAASRGDGAGSRNYVVFSDELIKVLRKYGISGLGIGTGTAIGAGAMQDDSSGI